MESICGPSYLTVNLPTGAIAAAPAASLRPSGSPLYARRGGPRLDSSSFRRLHVSSDGGDGAVPSSRRRSMNGLAVRAAAPGEGAGAATAESPADELKRKGDAYFSADARPIILFDGVCNMCNGGVNLMLDNDLEGKVRFAALQSEAGRALLVRSGRKPDDVSSIVLVCNDGSYIKSEAILRIGQHLSGLYKSAASAAFIFPLFLRDSVYDTVANNRYSVFGKTNTCRLSDPRFKERFVD